MKFKTSVVCFLIIFPFFIFAKDTKKDLSAARREAVTRLEYRTNKMLLQMKKKLPAKYKKMWAHNIMKFNFDDLMEMDIHAYNQLLSIQESYKQGLKTIKEKFKDVEMEAIEKRYKQKMENLYVKLEAVINKSVGPKTKQRFEKELDVKNFLSVKFNDLAFFMRRTRFRMTLLKKLNAIQKKYGAIKDQIEAEYKKEKKILMAKRAKDRKKRSLSFEEKVKKIEQEEKTEEKKESFWDNFWIGMKFGINYSTGSKGEKAKSAPSMGLMLELTFLKIKPIAFECSVEINVNYIQRPVTLDQGVINTDYINVPVFAKAKWPAHIPLGFGDLTPYIGIGIDPFFRLSSNFHYDVDGEDYSYESKGINFGFVWHIGGELNLFDIGTLTIEFRMSLSGSGVSEYTVPLSNIGYQDVTIPAQTQTGYLLFIGWKMALGTIFSIF